MLPKYIKSAIIGDDSVFADSKGNHRTPDYKPEEHYKDLCTSPYYRALITFRHYIKAVSDYYFGVAQGAKNIDLFMFASSASSPAGPGSNSKPLPVKIGKIDTFLTDSSQFGFEPLLLNNIDRAYCYLPSMRGEDWDDRHINQFYHCEMEMRGKLKDLQPIIEGYIKILSEAILLMDNIVNRISENSEKTKTFLKNIVKAKSFPKIQFSEAVDILTKHGKRELINFTKNGRDIKPEGETELMKIMNLKTPVWLTNFDRDRVPFYQKPDAKNPDKTINADLLFPSLIAGSFGGEIAGSGQRQDNAEQMYESLRRQNISSESYEWYIDIRRNLKYRPTSGFGLGIERFIACILGKKDIKSVIPYPRLKDVKTLP